MIRKILSSGEKGVERAALDVAIHLNIPHGGWCPSWREEEEPGFLGKYGLTQIQGGFSRAAEQNVRDSDGTLILYQNELGGPPALSRRLAKGYGRPCFPLDLDGRAAFQAARDIESWIVSSGLELLNITGPKPSRNRDLYRLAADILEVVFQLLFIEPRRYSLPMPEDFRPEDFLNIPRTLEAAVRGLLSKLTFREQSKIANMSQDRLDGLLPSLGAYIQNEFRLEGNAELKAACESAAPGVEPAETIIRGVWRKLQRANTVLRVVK